VAAACFALLEFLPLCGWFPCTTHPEKICAICVIRGQINSFSPLALHSFVALRPFLFDKTENGGILFV